MTLDQICTSLKYIVKYDSLAKELALINKCKVEIISHVMTWVVLVTKYHKKHRNKIEISTKTEGYFQSLIWGKLWRIYLLIEWGIKEDDGKMMPTCCK